MRILKKGKAYQQLFKGMVMLLFFLCLSTGLTYAQNVSISGVVTDKTNEPLIGVSVVLKGTTTGAHTDVDGKYTLSVPRNSKLLFSYIGYVNQEITVSGQTTIDVEMVEADKLLDEVVVVGYGVQKKVNLTGSVASISSKELTSRPLVNVSSGLGGLAPGVAVRQGTGEPGNDGAQIRIRGVGTLNSGAGPLIIIDGMEGDINTINPQDIENMSVLKDAASASIYGSRAANGVILITTKKGLSGKPKITFDATLSIARPTKTPKFITDFVSYMEYVNEGAYNTGLKPDNFPFKQGDFDNWKKANADPNGLAASGYPNHIAYPNTDWFDALFQTNLIQMYNINVTGGSDLFKYNLSLRYQNNPGIIDNSGTELYQGRINIDSKITNFLTVGTQTWFSSQDRAPANIKDADIFNWVRQSSPGVYPKYDDKYGSKIADGDGANANNVIGRIENARGQNQTNRLFTTWFAKFNIIKGLTFETKVNYTRDFTEKNMYNKDWARYDFAKGEFATKIGEPVISTSSYNYEKSHRITTDNVLNYAVTLNKDHDIAVLLGHNEYYYKKKKFGAIGIGLLDFDIPSLGTTTAPHQVSGMEEDNAMRSFFGRINYAYKSKYLLEANIRHDGSSRFAAGHKWGTFPSISLGWRVNQEDFVGEEFKNFFQNFKIRASYGKLGNNDIGDIKNSGFYRFMDSYTKDNLYYSFNGTEVSGLWVKNIGNRYIKWEETNVFDIALETMFLNERLTLEVDYYDRVTKGILYKPSIAGVLGNKEAPYMNLAEVTNKGVEITLGWQDKIRDFSYAINTNITYNHNNVSKYQGRLEEGWVGEGDSRVWTSNYGKVADGRDESILEGHLINEFRNLVVYRGSGQYFDSSGKVNPKGGPKDGMIRTKEDMDWAKAMVQEGYTFKPNNKVGERTGLYYGDLIYDDVNGDKIFGDEASDKVLMGASRDPKWIVGINVNAAYKGFDFSMLWQGSFKAKAYGLESGYNSNVVDPGWQVPELVAKDHYFYDPENPNDSRTNINGKYPRLKMGNDAINKVRSDFWLHSVSYMKLKNIQLGYTLPSSIVNKIKLSNLRVYVSAENILTISPFKGMDPETQSFTTYPPMKQFAFGLNLGF